MATSNSIVTQKPIQVKKVSQLPEYLSYYTATDSTLTLANSYLMIGYPSNDGTIPHNYKLSLLNLSKLMMLTIKESLKSLQDSIDVCKELIKKIKCKCDQEDVDILKYYWNLTSEKYAEVEDTIAIWVSKDMGDTELANLIEKVEAEWNTVTEDYNEIINETESE